MFTADLGVFDVEPLAPDTLLNAALDAVEHAESSASGSGQEALYRIGVLESQEQAQIEQAIRTLYIAAELKEPHTVYFLRSPVEARLLAGMAQSLRHSAKIGAKAHHSVRSALQYILSSIDATQGETSSPLRAYLDDIDRMTVIAEDMPIERQLSETGQYADFLIDSIWNSLSRLRAKGRPDCPDDKIEQFDDIFETIDNIDRHLDHHFENIFRSTDQLMSFIFRNVECSRYNALRANDKKAFIRTLSISDFASMDAYLYDILFHHVLFYDDFAIISLPPQDGSCDASGQLHAVGKPAVEWLDGMQIYAWHGVIVPADRAQYLLDPSTITAEAIMLEEDHAIQQMLAELSAYRPLLPLAEIVRETTQSNHLYRYYRVQTGDREIRFTQRISQ